MQFKALISRLWNAIYGKGIPLTEKAYIKDTSPIRYYGDPSKIYLA